MIYGKDFAQIYHQRWTVWGERVWPRLLEIVERQLRSPGATSWLDLCCGTGALLRVVSARGLACVGVDRSPHQLRIARREVPGATFLLQDVRELALPRTFDVATCTYDSLNYLTARRDLARVFRRVHRCLRPGGLFLFDVNTYEGLKANWRRTSTLRDRDALIVIESCFEPKRAIGRCTLTCFIRERDRYRRFDEVHVERGYHPEEIEGLLDPRRWHFRKLDGDTFGRARRRSGRLLYICRALKGPRRS